MLITLNQLTGLPVVWQGSVVGHVDHGVMDAGAERLMGLLIRRGLSAAKWVPSQGISLMGQRCVVARSRPLRIPTALPAMIDRVYLTNGSLAGRVTDVLLCRETQRAQALEICESWLGCLLGQRRYAVAYQIGRHDGSAGNAVVPELLSWAELRQRFEEVCQ